MSINSYRYSKNHNKYNICKQKKAPCFQQLRHLCFRRNYFTLRTFLQIFSLIRCSLRSPRGHPQVTQRSSRGHPQVIHRSNTTSELCTEADAQVQRVLAFANQQQPVLQEEKVDADVWSHFGLEKGEQLNCQIGGDEGRRCRRQSGG